jgi:lantibiotic modifying enzyme
MEQYLSKTALYIQQFGLAGSNYGLFHGNTGLSIFFYHHAKSTNNPEYELIADDLLDKVFANINTSASVDFENGLAGIGWGIEYLVQNGFAEGDTDEILEEVDNKVFKALNEDNQTSFELTNGLTGYLFYLISRLKKPMNPNSMAQRINRELLIMTINKLDELVTTQFVTITKEMVFDLFWRFPAMFYGLIQAFELNIYNEKIRCMINQWIMNLEVYIPSMHINRLYLATVLYQVNAIMPNKRLETHIQILLFATDFEILITEVDPVAINIRYGWPGVVWLLRQATLILSETYPNHSLIGMVCMEITHKFKPTLNHLQVSAVSNSKQFGLSEGLAGIGYMDLMQPMLFIE